MNPEEALEKLSALIDLELDESERRRILDWLESGAEEAERCRSMYHDLLLTKRLVHSKARRPLAPAGLRHGIERDLDLASARSARGTRRRLAWAAAAVLAISGGLFALTSLAIWPAPRLVHADMVRRCAEVFTVIAAAGDANAGTGHAEPKQCCEQNALECIREATGVALTALPEIPDALLVQVEECRFGRVTGVRLDYRSAVSGERPGILSVFAFPESSLGENGELLKELPHGTVCYCVRLPGTTVYCFRERDLVFNVFSNMDEGAFLSAHRPRSPTRDAARP